MKGSKLRASNQLRMKIGSGNVEKVNKKTLAYSLFAVTGINALLMIIFSIAISDSGSAGKGKSASGPLLLLAIVFIGFQVLLGYIILRDKNDKTTRISVILAVFFSVNPGYVLVFVLRLIMRNTGNPEKIRKYWFAPAIVAGVQGLISLCSDFNFATFIYLVSSTASCLIFGYWLIKYLELNE